MSPRKKQRSLEWQLLVLVPLALTAFGLVMVYSATSSSAALGNGNQVGWDELTSGQRRTIVWDDENRIRQISDNGRTTRFVYDDSGERARQRDSIVVHPVVSARARYRCGPWPTRVGRRHAERAGRHLEHPVAAFEVTAVASGHAAHATVHE